LVEKDPTCSDKNGRKNKCDKNKEQANKEKLKIDITFIFFLC
jgi:hypothetical protein